ncbi:MAG: hypothetical protein H0U08_06900 [Actinobacteria bacterium]|nr:hypothetical protein [Actinomycetota bacterium]
MRKRLMWFLVSLGIGALVRRLKRRGQNTEPTLPAPSRENDPADELRQKIAEAREDEAVEAPPTTETTVGERRADVHDQGRSALDDMREADES